MKERHVLGLSGGKDSAALAVHMNEKYPHIPIEYFFTDTGYELDETYKFLDKLKTRLSRSIKYICPTNTFDYSMKQYNNFLPSTNARWCTVEMKLKPFEAWIAPSLKEGVQIYTYIGIRYDERGRVGYKPTNPLIKAKFPFVDDCIDREGVTDILQNSGLGMPAYYKWRSRSGCQFCFFQRHIEWLGLKENHPEQFEYAKSLEKTGNNGESRFTWIHEESLFELEQPERVKAIKKNYQRQLERLKKMKAEKINNNPFLKGEDIQIEQNISQDDVSSSCLICHK
jgi:hypothetical protein